MLRLDTGPGVARLTLDRAPVNAINAIEASRRLYGDAATRERVQAFLARPARSKITEKEHT